MSNQELFDQWLKQKCTDWDGVGDPPPEFVVQAMWAAWQAALASKSAPVDWEKVVKQKFPDAHVDPFGSIWKKHYGEFLGYSWQHAAHHPDVIGGGK